MDRIKRFGCIGYIKIPFTESKFSERAIKAVLVGYTNTGSLMWHPPTNKFLVSRHVRFNEKINYKTGYAEKESTEDQKNIEDIFEMSEDSTEAIQPKNNKRKSKSEKSPPAKVRKLPERRAKLNPKRDESFIYRAQAETFQSEIKRKHDDDVYANIATTYRDPTSYREAMSSTEYTEWQKAVDEELKSMEENEVWELVSKSDLYKKTERPNIIDSRWVFKRKKAEDNSEKFKARLVIRGFKDKNEYQLLEGYAPVSRMTVIRAALAVINKLDLEVVQMDVKTAFLNGTLEEEVYMEIPGTKISENFKRTHDEAVLATFMDLSKAFDTVRHDLLLTKLEIEGIRGLALNLMKSYLFDRGQRVKINGVSSQIKTVSTGVPQGTVLGPLLFILYVNDIFHYYPGTYAFADDTIVVSHADTWSKVQDDMRRSLLEIDSWFTAYYECVQD
uniref:Reverse transcriptase domain-containing protein n=1 Tax=Trichogramma kaykai TaxID=54128 RepID=A0ABD2X055_9HYME